MFYLLASFPLFPHFPPTFFLYTPSSTPVLLSYTLQLLELVFLAGPSVVCISVPFFIYNIPSLFLFSLSPKPPTNPAVLPLYPPFSVKSVCFHISGPPVPCTCHRARPFDKSREGQTEFCRTRQSLNIWLQCPQMLCCVL